MASGDIEVYGPTTPDKLDDLLTGNSISASDAVTMCSYGDGMVLVLVVKA